MNDQGFDLIKPKKGFSINFGELWKYRELIYIFTWRDILSKYKQTILGLLWTILQPLSMILLFTFFFAKTLKVPTDNIPPPIFYFSGLLIWNFFSNSLANNANCIVENSHIIKKIYFPRLILPMSYALIAFFDFVIAFIIFLVLLLFYEWTTATLDVNYYYFLLYPLAIVLVIFSSVGLGSILAALNARFRDVKLMMKFIIQFLFFLTPVIYPVSVFESKFTQYILACNPAMGAINIMRAPFINDVNVSSPLILISGLSSTVLFALGIVFFKRSEGLFEDLV